MAVPLFLNPGARDDWAAGRFGEVHGYPGRRLAARVAAARCPDETTLRDRRDTYHARSVLEDRYWRGTGSLVTGISGAGLTNTSCWAVSSPASAAVRVMAAGDCG